jgi:hypothetical protein
MNGTQTATNGTQPVTHGTSSVTNSSQSDSTNQTAGRGAHDSRSEPLSSLSIFLVSDLKYDIFPVYSEDGSLCNVDQRKSHVFYLIIFSREQFFCSLIWYLGAGVAQSV